MQRRALERDYAVTSARLEASDTPEATGLARRLQRLKLTLLRIRNRDYGKCAACGKPISHARLKLIPTTGTCAACQQAIDRDVRRTG
jgi:RNA polymerase-binding transcription factor DksA